MQKNKLLSVALVINLLSVLSVFSVSAASPSVTLNLPVASSTISGSGQELNASLSAASAGLGNFTCLFYAASTLTANTTWTFIGSAENTTDSDANLTNFDTASLEDANNYVFNATCINDTETFTDDTNTGILINNTIPTAAVLDPATNTVFSAAGSQTFTGTVVARETTSCTYTIARGGATSGNDYESGTGTYSGTTCTFTKDFGNNTSPTADNGDWYWTITASDSTDTSTASGILSVQIPSVGGGVIVEEQEQQIIQQEQAERNQKTLLVLAILAVIVIVVVIILKRR